MRDIQASGSNQYFKNERVLDTMTGNRVARGMQREFLERNSREGGRFKSPKKSFTRAGSGETSSYKPSPRPSPIRWERGMVHRWGLEYCWVDRRAKRGVGFQTPPVQCVAGWAACDAAG